MLTSSPTLLLAKVTVVLLLALLAALALRRAPATARHRLWLATLGAVLVMPLFLRWTPLRVGILPAAALAPSSPRSGSAHAPIDRSAIAPNALPDAPAPSASASVAGTVATIATPARAARTTIAMPSAATLAILVWAIVALAILGVLVRAELAVRGVLRRARPLTAPAWLAMLYEIADRLGLDEPPALVQSAEVGMPFACGMRRAVVVLPADCDGWTDDRRRAVLLHELAHVRRRDLVGHAVSRVVSALWWFHPLVWTAARRLRVESERACDDLALAHGVAASDYAEHLLDIVTSARGTRMPVAALAMARPSEFEGRMLAILDPECPRIERHRVRAAAAPAVLALLALSLGAAAPARREPAESSLRAPATITANVAEQQRGAPSIESPAVDRALEPHGTRSHATPPVRTPALVTIESGTATTPAHPSTSSPDTAQPASRAELLARVLRTDTSARIRRVAAWGLADFLRQPAAVSALVGALRADRSADVREMAAWALADAQAGGDAEQALVAALAHDGDSRVRASAAWALGNVGDAHAVPTLTAALSDSSADVRERAVWALGNAGIDAAPKQVVAMLADRSPRVRRLAAWTLYQIGDASAIPALDRALHDESDPQLQVAYVRALAATGDASTEALSALVQSPDPRIRDVAVRALASGNARGPWPWPWPEPRPYP